MMPAYVHHYDTYTESYKNPLKRTRSDRSSSTILERESDSLSRVLECLAGSEALEHWRLPKKDPGGLGMNRKCCTRRGRIKTAHQTRSDRERVSFEAREMAKFPAKLSIWKRLNSPRSVSRKGGRWGWGGGGRGEEKDLWKGLLVVPPIY